MRIFIVAFLLCGFNTHAIAAANYVIIENQIDDEYFIAPDNLSPRFTGANKFTRYDTKQDSLGYMGTAGGAFNNSYNVGDLWLENSPVPQPFQGNRCRNKDSNCPSSGMWSPDSVRNNGVYRIVQTRTPGESKHGRPILTDAFYQYLTNLKVNTNSIFRLRSCAARPEDYPNDSVDCMSLPRKIVSSEDVNVTNIGNLVLKSTGALQEIFVDSNGQANIGLGAKFCSIAYDKKYRGGIVCRLVEYDLKGILIDKLRLSLNINMSMLGVSRVNSNDALVSADGANWRLKYGSEVNMKEIVVPGGDGIYIFLGSNLLRDIVGGKSNISLSDSAFTFSFRNTKAPQSGYYEFTPSNYVIIKPKEFGISIIPADYNPNPHKFGKAGYGNPPIEFQYIVTTTGTRQADSITAKVEGPKVNKNNYSYCLFRSNDDRYHVPFSAYLSFYNANGHRESYRASCDGNEISLKNAAWVRKPWDKPKESLGSYYRTHLSLLFPMDEDVSQSTVLGSDWQGAVSASGTITVKATWTGPDIP